MASSIALTVLFALSWLFFPEIGSGETSAALGPWFSYIYPMLLIWFFFVATFAPGKIVRVFSDAQLLFALLLACWGFAIWNALMVTPPGVIVALARLFAFVIVGWIVVILYWGALLLMTVRFVMSIPRFIAGLHYI